MATMLQFGSAFFATGAFAMMPYFATSSAVASTSVPAFSVDAWWSAMNWSTSAARFSSTSLRTTVTPVRSFESGYTLFHSSVREKATFSWSFCAVATVTNGCGRIAIWAGSCFRSAAISVASDLNCTSQSVTPFFSRR